MFFPSISHYVNTGLKEVQMNEILQINNISKEYGLILTKEEAEELIEERNFVLQSHGRVELDIEVTKKLVETFCSSPYINQQDYASTLNDLQEIFYYVKNETEDSLSDDELIETMCNLFNTSCHGSIELLIGRELEPLAESIRKENQMTDFLMGGDV